MANQVTLTFAGDSEQLEKKFARVEQATDSIEKEFQQADRSAADLQDAFREVGKSAKHLDKAADEARDLGKSLNNVEDSGEGVANVMSGLGDGLEILGEQFGLPTEKLGSMLGLMGQVGQAAGDLGGGMRKLVPQIGAMTSAVRANTIAMMTNPIVLGAVGIALLIAGIILLIKYWDEITEKVPFLGTAVKWVTDRFDDLKGGIMSVIDWVKQHWPEIATIISGPFAPLVMLATDAFGIRSALIGAFNGIKNHVRDVLNWLIEKVNSVSSKLNKLPGVDVPMIPTFGDSTGGGAGGAPGVEVPRGIIDDSGARAMAAGSRTEININGPVYGTNYSQLAYEVRLELQRAGVQ